MTMLIARLWVTFAILLIYAFVGRLGWCCYRPGLEGPGRLEAVLGGALMAWFVLGAIGVVWTS